MQLQMGAVIKYQQASKGKAGRMRLDLVGTLHILGPVQALPRSRFTVLVSCI